MRALVGDAPCRAAVCRASAAADAAPASGESTGASSPGGAPRTMRAGPNAAGLLSGGSEMENDGRTATNWCCWHRRQRSCFKPPPPRIERAKQSVWYVWPHLLSNHWNEAYIRLSGMRRRAQDTRRILYCTLLNRQTRETHTHLKIVKRLADCDSEMERRGSVRGIASRQMPHRGECARRRANVRLPCVFSCASCSFWSRRISVMLVSRSV